MATTMAWLPNSSRIANGGGVNADFVCARTQNGAHVLYGADAAAHGKGDEDLIGDGAGHLQNRAARFVRGGDVQKDQLVGAFSIVDARLLHRVARVTQIHKIDALHDTPIFDVETGDNTFG